MAKKKPLTPAQKKAAAQKAKDKITRAKKISAENKKFKPTDYIRGDLNPGKTYTAADNYGQGTVDRGNGAGPGEPYHEVKKKIPSRASSMADYARRSMISKNAAATAQKAKTSESLAQSRIGTIPAYRRDNSKLMAKFSKANSNFRADAIRRRLNGVK